MQKKVDELFSIYEKFIDELRGLVVYKSHKMRKGTLEKFLNLELVLESQGYKARITSTTTGNHQNPAHKEGDAVDFKVYKGGKEISPSDSFHIEEVCKKMGWAVY